MNLFTQLEIDIGEYSRIQDEVVDDPVVLNM